MKYRNVKVKQRKNGSYDVTTTGCLAQSFYWWLLALFVVAFVIQLAHYWYISVPVILVLVWLVAWRVQVVNRRKAKEITPTPVKDIPAPPSEPVETSEAAAGWYPIGPNGAPRYWDGTQWTSGPTAPPTQQ
jgi:hypothetical protein